MESLYLTPCVDIQAVNIFATARSIALSISYVDISCLLVSLASQKCGSWAKVCGKYKTLETYFQIAFRKDTPALSPWAMLTAVLATMSAKSLQSCLILLRPRGLQATRLLCPWDSPRDKKSQARIWERVAGPSCRGSSRPREWTGVSYASCICRCVLHHYSTWEALLATVDVLFFLLSKLSFLNT